MRQVTKKTIDDVEYVFTPLAPTVAAKLLPKIMKSIGQPVSKLLAGVDLKKGLDQSFEDEKFAEALGGFLSSMGENLDDETLTLFMNTLLKEPSLAADGKKVVSVDSHFGNYQLSHMFKVLKVALEVNYGDFLGGLVAKIGS